MSDLSTLKVGDKITVKGSYGWSVRKVAIINKSFLIDSKQNKWAVRSGRAWGSARSGWETGAFIDAWDAEDDSVIAGMNAERKLKLLQHECAAIRPHQLSAKQCKAILKIVNSEQGEQT